MSAQTPKLDEQWLLAKRRASAAFEAHDAMSMLEAETLADLYSAKKDFVDSATRLARRLIEAAERVEGSPGDHFSVNGLGEVQSQGVDVDRVCYAIAGLRKAIADVGVARKAAEHRAPEKEGA